MRSAPTATPSTSPLEASIPDAMSQAMTGAPQRSIASIAAAAGSRGDPRESRPEDRIDHCAGAGEPLAQPLGHLLRPKALQVGCSVCAQLLGGPEQQRLHLISHPGQAPRRHQPIARVVPLAADDPHRPLGRQPRHRLGHSAPSGLHQLERRHPPLLDRPAVHRTHPLGVIEDSEPGLHPFSLTARRGPAERSMRSPQRRQRHRPGILAEQQGQLTALEHYAAYEAAPICSPARGTRGSPGLEPLTRKIPANREGDLLIFGKYQRT